jgi:hypothetical protein
MLKVVRWDDEYPWFSAHAHQSPNLPQPNLTQTDLFRSDIRLYAFNNSGTGGRIFIEFGAEITPLEPSLQKYFFNFWKLVLSSCRMLKVVRWYDDPLRMCISNLIYPNPTSQHLTSLQVTSFCAHLITRERMKFGMEIMPLEPSLQQ